MCNTPPHSEHTAVTHMHHAVQTHLQQLFRQAPWKLEGGGARGANLRVAVLQDDHPGEVLQLALQIEVFLSFGCFLAIGTSRRADTVGCKVL